MKPTNNKNKQLAAYLADFQQGVENRSLSTIFFSHLFENLLEWHWKFWQKELSVLGKNNTDLWSEYWQIFQTLTSIITTIHNKVLSTNSIDATYFYQAFGKHIEKYKDSSVTVKQGDTRFYIVETLREFYRVFFEKAADSPHNFEIWDLYFPKNWFVTIQGVENEDRIQMLTLIEFLRWAESRIVSHKEKDYDRSIDDLSDNLFPETDPPLWAEILTFVCSLSPFYLENRVKYILERPRVFGFAGRMREFSGSGVLDQKKFDEDFQKYREDMDGAEKAKTIQLTFALTKKINTFHHIFTKENLTKFITEAESLETEFKADQFKDDRREKLQNFFRALLEMLQK